jgi:DHA3 family macrolide efflux protein-like MFS transporter
MRLFRPLRDRNMAVLWLGASIAGLGLQVYDSSIAWFMVEALGSRASLVVTATAAISLLFSLFGGLLVDRFDEFAALTWIDGLRGLLVLVPVVWLVLSPDSTWIFAPAVLLMALLRPLPLPIAYAALPRLSADPRLLNAMNALIDGSQRMARILGPMLIGALQVITQQIWILGVAALCFFASAFCASRVARALHPVPDATATAAAIAPVRPIRDVLDAMRAARAHAALFYSLIANMVSNGAWQLGLMLGIVLMIQGEKLGDIGGYASVIAAYGCGNLASNLVVGNLAILRPARWTLAGHGLAGLGYILMALSPDITWLMAAAAITAAGPPLADLSFLGMIQADPNRRMVARFYRLKLVGAWIGGLVASAAGVTLFAAFSARLVVGACGLMLLLAAVLGYLWQQRRPQPA